MPLEARTLAAALPRLNVSGTGLRALPSPEWTAAGVSLGSTVMHAHAWALGNTLGLTPATVAAGLACTYNEEDLTLCNIVQAAVGCDMESVQLCTRHHRDLIWAVVVLVPGYLPHKMG